MSPIRLMKIVLEINLLAIYELLDEKHRLLHYKIYYFNHF